MAKRYSSKKGRNLEPAVQTLYIQLPSFTGLSTNYLDLSQVASLVNRRFYRQGINWAVAGFKFVTPANYAGYFSISKLPNTWVMANAWVKAFKAWQKMNNEALAESDTVRPKFLDFKVFADAEHHAAGFGANLLPESRGPVGAAFTAGEWEPSKFVIPLGNADPGDTEEFEIIATGASYPGNAPGSTLNAVSLIEGYASSRALPNVLDPNVPSDSADAQGVDPENWIQALFNEGIDQSTEVLESMISENNIAPYPFEGDGTHTDTMYPNGANQGVGLAIHDFSYVTPSTVGGHTHLKGGNFPCGLIRIDSANTGEATGPILMVDLIPGTHRGYLCEPMMEM